MVPNHPRYQLRYTRIFTFRFLEISLSVVKAVVKCNFGVLFNGGSNPAITRVPRALSVSEILGSDTGTALPNHPRYQLRYTRIFTFRFLEISLSVVKAVVKCNFGVHFNGRSNPAIDRVPRASGVSVSHGSDIGTALPNVCLNLQPRLCGALWRFPAHRRILFDTLLPSCVPLPLSYSGICLG